MARIKNTNVYIFDNVPEPSSFLVGSDQGDGRITKSYRIDTIFGLLPSYGYFTDAPADGLPYLRQDNSWVEVPSGSGAGDVFKVFGRTGNILARGEDYDSFYSLLGHTHLESDITDLQAYLLPIDIGNTVQAWSTALDNVSGTNTGDQNSIVGITGNKLEFNTALSDGAFMFIGDAPTSHTHTESEITDLKDYLLGADLDTLAKLNFILTDNTLIGTDDVRLTDARTPLSHTHLEADITDLQNYLLSVNMDDINALGTPSASTWLRGDGAWGTILAGVSSVFGRTADVVAEAGDYDAFYYTESEIDVLLSNYEVLANKGLANGYAPLNASGLIDSSFLPAFVDDVLEYADEASFPATGEVGKIYMDLAENTLFRWSGTVYVQVGVTDNIPWGGITGLLSNQTDLAAKFGEYLPLTGGTLTGRLTVKSGNNAPIIGEGSGLMSDNTGACLFIGRDSSSTNMFYIGMNSSVNSDLLINSYASGQFLRLLGTGGVNGLQFYTGSVTQTVWHTGNDGAGSGLDADLLDGVSWGNVNTNIVTSGSLTASGVISNVNGYRRLTSNEGILVGSYSQDGGATASVGTIYAMGTSFKPTSTTDFGNLYGIGYCYGSVMNGTNGDIGTTVSNQWGMYVAADGEARHWLNGTTGVSRQKGAAYASNFILNSDERVKNYLKDYSPSEMNVEWKSFELKSEEGVPRVGVSAQQLLKHHPEFVEQTDTKNYTVRYIDLLCAKMAEKDRQIELLNNKLGLLIKELL